MTALRVIGAVLVVVGLIGLLAGGVSWTEKETVLDIGPIEATAEERKTLPIPPWAGGLALAAGVVLLIVPARSRRTT
jgi:hypothetical protein